MKKTLSLLGLAFILIMSNAFAFNPLKSKSLIEEALQLTQQHQFTAAYYKFKTIRLDTLSLKQSQIKTKLILAIDTSIEKLNDFSLDAFQKVSAVEDCAQIAYKQLKLLAGPIAPPIQPVSVQETTFLINQVLLAVQNYNEEKAFYLLKKIHVSLKPFSHDRDIKKALDAVVLVFEKVKDPGLSAAQKEEVALDCVLIFQKAIQNFIAKTTPPPFIDGGGFSGGCPSSF